MPRLKNPDPHSIPDDVARFLATLPPDAMFTTLSHSPATVQPLLGLARALYTSLELPARTRELAILTLAAHTESAFVWTQHEPISEAAGVTDTTRKLIRDHDHTHPALSEPDQAVLQFTASVVTGPHVSDELFTALRSVLSEREIVELLHVIGYYWTLSRISTVLQIEATHLYAREYGSSWPEEADL
jgi:alkylhydroperoxidase family enzyme